jgi:hypothetical protein
MSRNRPQAADKQGETSPRLELNRRQRAIVESGILASLRPSALVVLHYAIAHADFTKCTVYLGARTIADRARLNRSSVRLGINELIAVGILAVKRQRTFTRATVYGINAPAVDRVEGSTLGGRKAPSSQGAGLHPERVEGSTPKHALHASPKRSMRKRRRAEAPGVAGEPDQTARLRALRITPKASGLSVKESWAEKNLSRIG